MKNQSYRMHPTSAVPQRWCIAVLAGALVLGGSGLIAAGSPAHAEPAEATAGAEAADAALVADRDRADLGRMSLDAIRSADFVLTNSGTEPVTISEVETSCMCTFAEINLSEGKSPRFNMAMHNTPEMKSWKALIEPGETATVTVIYEPSLMPVEGEVFRSVRFTTSDPQTPRMQLGVTAIVESDSSGS